jgi:colanic acid biosynthesis glycosyl transferase WcaI
VKILLISTNYSPELTGVGKYSGEMISWLAEQGHEVRVVCAPPYYPQWKVGKGYSSWRFQIENSLNKKVYRCPLWVPAKPSGLKRIIHLASFAFSSLPIVLRQIIWRPAVVICVEPSLFNSFGAIIAGKLSGAKSILHIQDFEVDAAFELGIVKVKWLKHFVYGVERFLMNRFDKVSTISEAMLEKLNKKSVDPVRQIFLPNWVDTTSIYPLETISRYRTELNIPSNKIVALYSGNMGEKQGLEIVIQAAKKLENENIQFIMCGSGAALERLKILAKELKNILWLPLQPFEHLNEFLNVADIHLLPQQSGVADLVMPSKLTGMLASGKPIIATADVDTQVEKVVKECGIVVSTGNVMEFVKSIRMLSENVELRENLGIKARTYADNHLQYEVIMKKFEIELLKLVR